MREAELVISPHLTCCDGWEPLSPGRIHSAYARSVLYAARHRFCQAATSLSTSSSSLVNAVHSWGDSYHSYSNLSTSLWGYALCLDRPGFIATDEQFALPHRLDQCGAGGGGGDVDGDMNCAAMGCCAARLQPSVPADASSEAPASPSPYPQTSSHPGDEFWARLVLPDSASPLSTSADPQSEPLVLEFPGALPGQIVQFELRGASAAASSAASPPDAALCFALVNSATAGASAAGSSARDAVEAAEGEGRRGTSEPSLVFVQHRKRGWEVPGGKREQGETAIAAALRELREEGGDVVAAAVSGGEGDTKSAATTAPTHASAFVLGRYSIRQSASGCSSLAPDAATSASSAASHVKDVVVAGLASVLRPRAGGAVGGGDAAATPAFETVRAAVHPLLWLDAATIAAEGCALAPSPWQQVADRADRVSGLLGDAVFAVTVRALQAAVRWRQQQ